MVMRVRGMMGVAVAALVLVPAARALGDDAADAKKAVEGFLGALKSGDEKAIKACVNVTPEYKDAVNAYLDLMIATTQLQKAAAAKFGATATEKTFGSTSGPLLESRLQAIREAPIKITGDSALLTVAPDPATHRAGGTIVLVKTAGAGGGWKIDGASLFNLSPENAQETRKNVALAVKLLAITNKMIEEINAGKYAAAVDAFEEFWTQSTKAAKEVSAPAKGAETAPGTQAK